MKNRVVLVLSLITLFILTGCSNSTQKLSCSATENKDGININSQLEVKVNKDEIKNMRLKMTVAFAENQEMYKESMMSQVLQKTKEVYTTKDGFEAIFGMGNSYFKELGLSKDASFGELKQVLILQGYTCE